MVTARPQNNIEWFFDSLKLNHNWQKVSQIVIVDKYAEACHGWTERDVAAARNHVYDAAGVFAPIVQHVPPKPCVWSGKHRLTPRDWWSTASYRNTALCYCRSDFLAMLDDRCVLAPTWLDAVLEAKVGGWAVCGTYSKQVGMTVVDGVITNMGETIGKDSRMEGIPGERRMKCPGVWMFGCTFALPTEWMLQVNGVDESWDSVSMEDTHFGQMLENNGFPIYHDSRMKMVEDRTPAEQDAKNREHDMKRSSKERYPHDKEDKTHTLIKKLWNNKRAAHPWDLTVIRNRVLAGHAFPIPLGPHHDWFDGQPLAEMT